MANKMLLDDTRALRREQREARIARKRERREARALKHQHHTIGLETLALETIDIAPSAPRVEEPAPAAETVAPEPARPPVTTAAETSASQQPTPEPGRPGRGTARQGAAAGAGRVPTGGAAPTRHRRVPRAPRREAEPGARGGQGADSAARRGGERARRADSARAPRGLPLAAAPRAAVPGDRDPADPGDRGGGTACLPRRGRRRGENIAQGAGPGHGAGGRHRLRDHRPGAVGDVPQPARRAQRPTRKTRRPFWR